MMRKDYQLSSTVSKVIEEITLWQTERGIIEISQNTLAVPITLDDEVKGYVFHGHGRLLLDAIAETEKGAVGKSIEKELDELFIMLGDKEKIEEYLTATDEEDFTRMGYEDEKGFITRAEDLCDQFFGTRRWDSHQFFHKDHGLIFAFPNRAKRLDILVTKGSKLIYKTTDIVFVSNENKIVLKSPSETVVSSKGKLLVINKNDFLRCGC